MTILSAGRRLGPYEIEEPLGAGEMGRCIGCGIGWLDRAASPPVTEAGVVVGTFQCMSPEQVEAKEVEGDSDI